MKKDRNSFFGSTNFNMNASGMDNMLPYMQQMMPNPVMPNINTLSSFSINAILLKLCGIVCVKLIINFRR